MEKIYIKPETIVVTIDINRTILVGSEKEFDPDKDQFDPIGGSSDDAEADGAEYSRNSNGGNVWDNAW